MALALSVGVKPTPHKVEALHSATHFNKVIHQVVTPPVTLQPQPVEQPETPDPVPVPPAPDPPPPPAPVPITACGSDPQMAYIYTVESGCRTNALNGIGCLGLGQACPGSKLPCSVDDWACQDAWFRNYAVERYGSIANAYAFRVSHNWW